jgi:hypothetical protein
VFYTRILHHLFTEFEREYGERIWPDFFRLLRQQRNPLPRVKRDALLAAYADLFSTLFRRDMRIRFTEFGIDLDADPPWGWETHRE